MQLQEDFSLEAILSVILGINCTQDLGEIYDLYCFMFEDEAITEVKLKQLRGRAKNHILNIHPNLRSIYYSGMIDLNEWLETQKEILGDRLPISIIGEPIYVPKKQPILR